MLSFTGCADPDGKFDAFVERYGRTHAGTDAGTDGDGGVCVLPTADEVSGRFLLVVSPAFSPKTPLLFLDDLSASSTPSDALELGMTLTALHAKDRTTPVGPPLSPVSMPVAAGAFSFELGVLEIVGEADPIIFGAPIIGSVILDGELCGGPFDFSCGSARGHVTVPAELDLAGSTWTLARIAANGALPDIAINCAKDAPDPL